MVSSVLKRDEWTIPFEVAQHQRIVQKARDRAQHLKDQLSQPDRSTTRHTCVARRVYEVSTPSTSVVVCSNPTT